MVRKPPRGVRKSEIPCPGNAGLLNGVLVGLSATTSHGTRPGERKTRLLLEVLRDREADVLRFALDLKVPATAKPMSAQQRC